MMRCTLALGLLAAVLLVGARDASAEAKTPCDVLADESADEFWWGDFDALERKYARVRTATERDAQGNASVACFRRGLLRVFQNNDYNQVYYEQLQAMTAGWARAHPQSALAQLLHTRVLLARGLALRGLAYDADTPAASKREFLRYLALAEQQLVTHADVVKGESSADVYLMMLGRWEGWPLSRMRLLVDDGLAKNASDDALWEEMVLASQPKWGGNAAEIDRVARDAAKSAPAQGLGAYAMLYDAIADSYGARFFKDTRADWPTLRQGYRDRLAAYPDDWVLNRFARMACLAEDKPTTQALIAQIGSKPRPDAWGSNAGSRLDACRAWARTP